MPYIKLEERPKFQPLVMETLGLLKDPTDTIYIKGEYFGYWTNRLCKRWLGDQHAGDHAFNSFHFNEGKRKALSYAADTIAASINRADPIATAGELNYAISAVLWGFLGEAEGFTKAGYGVRTYFASMLEKVRSTVDTVNTGSQRDMAMAFRRHLIVRNVLSDVMQETYRRFTAPYEDEKMGATVDGQFVRLANDVWLNGKLNLPTTGSALVTK